MNKTKIFIITVPLIFLISNLAVAENTTTPAETNQQQTSSSCISCQYMQDKRYGKVITELSLKQGLLGYKDLLNLGTAYLIKDDPQHAVPVFESILEKYPDDPAAMNNMAVALYANGQKEASDVLMENVATVANYIYPIIFNQAQMYVFNNELDEATSSFKQIRSEPVSSIGMGMVYLAKKDYRDAADTLNLALSSYKNDPAIYRALGLAYAGMGQTNSAIENLKKATDLDVKLIGTFSLLSLQENDLGMHQQAEESIDQGLSRLKQIKGNNYLYYYYITNFAETLNTIGDFNRSLSLINSALLHVKDISNKEIISRMYKVAGNDYYNLKDFNNAIQYYSSALKYHPDEESSYIWIARSYFSIEDKANRVSNLKNAIRYIEKAVSANPDDATAFEFAGDIYYTYSLHMEGEEKTEQFNKSVLAYRRALVLSPANKSIELKLGALYYISNKDKLSIESIEKAIQHGVNLEKALPLLAGVYYISKNNVKAMATYNQVIEMFPSYCNAYIAKGLIFTQSGKKNDAKLAFDSAKQCEARHETR